MIKILAVLAGLGLVLSMAAHGLTWFGVDPARVVPGAWLLHVGAILVCVAAVFTLQRRSPDAWEQARRRWPWPYALIIVLGFYTIFNFFYSTRYLNEGGVPAELNGELVLHSHGHVIRKLTPQEFEEHKAYTLRGFSGHWMIFYAAALFMLAGAACSGQEQGPSAGTVASEEKAPIPGA